MNKPTNQVVNFLVSFLLFVTLLVCAYQLIMYNYSKIKQEPKNLKYATLKQLTKNLDCLADNIYYEANNQPVDGKILVAQITLNRVNSGEYPNDICKVIAQPYQFSWVYDKPRSLRARDKKGYDEAMEVAKIVLIEGFRLPSLKNSLWYHSKQVNPTWNRNMKVDAIIGNHIAYSKKD